MHVLLILGSGSMMTTMMTVDDW